jgi:hypothetical protein
MGKERAEPPCGTDHHSRDRLDAFDNDEEI